MKGRALILSVTFLVFCDQLSKWYIQKLLKAKHFLKIFPFFHLVKAWNSGVSWGFLAGPLPWKKEMMITLNILICFFFINLYFKSKRFSQKIGLIAILSGAIGNTLDRFFYGSVFDFLFLHWGKWHFPVFNVADILISIGFLMMLRDHYQWNYLKKSKNTSSA